MKHKSVGLAFSQFLFLSSAAFAAPEADFQGSCTFEGQYASGCIEIFDAAWDSAKVQSYCQAQSKPDLVPTLSREQCAKTDYDSLCATQQADGLFSNIYVNGMPSFICSKFMSGVLTKRPAEGWAEVEAKPAEPVVVVVVPEPTGPVLHGSCAFEGQYASGCIEFVGGTWDTDGMQAYCQEKSKPDLTPQLVKAACPKTDYNTLCATTLADGSLGNMYVNNLPGFICSKYMSGELTKRPATGW